jgi:hypothetical protein
MSKSLKDIVKRTVQVACLGGAVMVSGCFGAIMMGAAPYSKDPRAGQSMYNVGDALSRNEAAERGRSNVEQNVYVYPQGSEPDRGEETMFIRDSKGEVFKVKWKDLKKYTDRGFKFPAKATSNEFMNCKDAPPLD